MPLIVAIGIPIYNGQREYCRLMVQEIHRLRYAGFSFADAVGWVQKYPDESKGYVDKARQAFQELGKVMYTAEVPNSLRETCLAFLKTVSSQSFDYTELPPKLAPWPLSDVKKEYGTIDKKALDMVAYLRHWWVVAPR